MLDMTSEPIIDSYKLYKDMCASLRKDGLSTEGMYTAYLLGELRRTRARLKELEHR